CDSVVFVNLTFVASIEAAVKTTSPICLGDVNGSIEITEIMGGQPPYVVALDGSNSTQVTTLPLIFNDLDAGTHQLTFQDALGTLSVQEVEIPAPQVLLLDLGDDQTIQLGESVSLLAQASFPVSTWQWSPADFLSCTDCASPTAEQPTGDVTYLVTATDANGCTVEDEIKVFVKKIREVFVPNAFSPNGDGFNDVLTVFAGQQVANVKIFKVFNRWGAVMFELENYSPNQVTLGWDGTFKGKKMDVGVYVWFAEVEFLDGEVEVFEGGVTLVR
ncbi:MAG: gliding motility-associated C-terminal domain-containing protein, partial [Bacteroidota bacterium]